MKKKRFWLVASIVLMILIGGSLVVPYQLLTQVPQNPGNRHSAMMKKIGKKWRANRITAKRDEEISWSFQGADLYFQFMDSTLFGQYNYHLQKNGTLTLKVKGASGTYPYAIFNMADSSFVMGDSAPTIIIF
jgi:hypothetical protein